eukprot:COSAG02_NODE_314_length_24915_cov_18.575596_12_plen_150_part_00
MRWVLHHADHSKCTLSSRLALMWLLKRTKASVDTSVRTVGAKKFAPASGSFLPPVRTCSHHTASQTNLSKLGRDTVCDNLWTVCRRSRLPRFVWVTVTVAPLAIASSQCALTLSTPATLIYPRTNGVNQQKSNSTTHTVGMQATPTPSR